MISKQKPGNKRSANEAKNEEVLSSFSKRLNMKPVRQTMKVLTNERPERGQNLSMTSRISNVIGDAAMKELKIMGLQLRG